MTAIKFALFILVAALAVYWAWPKRKAGRAGVPDSLVLSPARVVVSVMALIALLLTYPAVGMISAGYRGVVLQFGAVTGRVLDEGFYVVTPFVNDVAVMSVRTEAYEVPAEAASNDLQDVHTKVTLNYSLAPASVAEVYRTLRGDYERIIIKPAVQEAVKASTALFSAGQLITNRPIVKDKIETALRTRLAQHGIIVDPGGLSITDFEFSESFNAAIEAKVTATQKALEAEQNLQRVKFEAQQVITQAEAQAKSISLQGAALRANPELVALRWVEKWDGHMPQTILGQGQGVIPLINLDPDKDKK